ncbi:hypothetical protein BO86DRAFT_390985 [Aspergillus japonicus CBS 114.51]|uniref:Uncharacterized protein n=1 Tax=Aspergillus japonicus CBS 114.51 TaxID=1448312 RepID=A0A8T8WUA4_ASPJA|nr:hypothetical protein BO86DRAFT_390985 [Aspergillus japonicus CBS 114.51]RAH79428.1 hypothetical protein BO86DRAFT_390985 [Aspergillus japonicus CBS 114.51]
MYVTLECAHTTTLRAVAQSSTVVQRVIKLERSKESQRGSTETTSPAPSPGMLATCPRKTANPTLRPQMHHGSLQLKLTLAQTREERQGWQRREAVSQSVSQSVNRGLHLKALQQPAMFSGWRHQR